MLQQLKSDGILVAPVGSNDPMQTVVKVVKKNNSYEYTDLKRVKFLPIIEGKDPLRIDRSFYP